MENEWKSHWESMTVDDLFVLREQMQEVLSAKQKGQKSRIRASMQSLNRLSNITKLRSLAGLNRQGQTRSSLSAGGAMTSGPVCFTKVKLGGFRSLYQPSELPNFGHSIKKID